MQQCFPSVTLMRSSCSLSVMWQNKFQFLRKQQHQTVQQRLFLTGSHSEFSRWLYWSAESLNKQWQHPLCVWRGAAVAVVAEQNWSLINLTLSQDGCFVPCALVEQTSHIQVNTMVCFLWASRLINSTPLSLAHTHIHSHSLPRYNSCHRVQYYYRQIGGFRAAWIARWHFLLHLLRRGWSAYNNSFSDTPRPADFQRQRLSSSYHI